MDVGPALADAFRAEYVFMASSVADPQAMAALFQVSGSPTMGGTPPNPLHAVPGSIATKLSYFCKPNQTTRECMDFFRPPLEDACKLLAQVRPPRQRVGGLLDTPLKYFVPNSWGSTMLLLLTPSYGGVHKLKSQCQTDTAATQVLVALRCFKLKTGRLPQKLDELVPEYLPAVPLDDFDGKPIRYSAEKKIVYSVGVDFQDSGGMTREEARKWWEANRPNEPLEEGEEPREWDLPDASWPIEF